MTQADGTVPTAAEIRLQLRLVKPMLERLETTLVASARVPENTSVTRQFKALAELSAAHAELSGCLAALGESLGLPYDEVIVASYTALFGPDD